MKKCWNHDPENRPTARETCDCLQEHCKHDRTEENIEIIKPAETKRHDIIKPDKFLLDIRNCKHYPKSFYTSCLLDKSIQQAESSLNFSSTEPKLDQKT